MSESDSLPQPAARPRLGALAVGLLVVAGVIGFYLWLFYPRSDLHYWGTFNLFVDLHVYRWGGDYVLHHLQLYPGLIHSLEPGQEFRGPMAFTYTPFAAIFFTPLAAIGMGAMEYLWMTLTLVCLAASIWWMLRWLGHLPSQRLVVATLGIAGAMLFIEPVRTTLWYGQINLLLLALLTYDAAAPARRFGRGICTGIAAGIKLTPAFFFAYYFMTKQWRTLMVSIASAVGTIVIGFVVIFRDSAYYWTGGLLENNRIGNLELSANQSLNGAVARYIFHSPEPPQLAWLAVGIPAALLGLTAVWALHRVGQQQLGFALAGMTGAMVSPFSWGHHWVWFVPLFVVIINAAIQARSWGQRALFVVATAALYFMVGAWTETTPNPDFPGGLWVSVGWFMHSLSLEGPFSPFFREPYLIVWFVVMLAVPFIVRRCRVHTQAATAA